MTEIDADKLVDRLRNGHIAEAAEDAITAILAMAEGNKRLREALERCHETLHECTAVLTASDCAKVAAVMTDARRALGKDPKA